MNFEIDKEVYSKPAGLYKRTGALKQSVILSKKSNGVEVKVSLSDIKKYKPERMEDLMEKPLKDLIEMAKSVCEKGE